MSAGGSLPSVPGPGSWTPLRQWQASRALKEVEDGAIRYLGQNVPAAHASPPALSLGRPALLEWDRPVGRVVRERQGARRQLEWLFKTWGVGPITFPPLNDMVALCLNDHLLFLSQLKKISCWEQAAVGQWEQGVRRPWAQCRGGYAGVETHGGLLVVFRGHSRQDLRKDRVWRVMNFICDGGRIMSCN